MRVINNSYVEEQERHPEGMKRFPEQLIQSAQEGVLGYGESGIDTDRTCMPAGQGIGGISDVPTAAEIIARLLRQTDAAIARLKGLIDAD
jgi:NAD(P)H-dependent flavin oxidoreductase YrpB (nitropropane dioxygenase family)